MTRQKTPLELAALATVAMPGLKVAGLRPPSYSDEVLSVTGIIDTKGNRWTVSCPHDTIGGLDSEVQFTVLGRLAKAHDHQRIPFDVPRPAGSTHTAEGDRVLVHKDLGGRAMTEEDFEDSQILPVSLGRSLAALHNLPELIYTGANLPAYTAAECRTRHLAVLDEAARATVIPANLWERWETALENVSLWRFATAPLHADLELESIIVTNGSVTALTGFHGAHIGDPAMDISWVLARSSDAFLERFREAYSMQRSGTDLHLFTRAQLISELALVRWLVHGLRADDPDIVEEAREMLADLSADLGDDYLVRALPSGDIPIPSEVPSWPIDEDGAEDHAESQSRSHSIAQRKVRVSPGTVEDFPTGAIHRRPKSPRSPDDTPTELLDMGLQPFDD